MLTTDTLTEKESQLVHNLAITLVKEDADVNELGKAIAYLRSIGNEKDAGIKFFRYLNVLTTNGRQIGHSRKTTDYYRSIESACNKFLQGEKANAENMLKILGWAMRLMRYYKVSPIEEIVVTSGEGLQDRQTADRSKNYNFKVGQILEAKIIVIKGNKVTYEIFGDIKMTEKEPKKAALLSEGQKVNVEILDLKEDSSIRKIKLSE